MLSQQQFVQKQFNMTIPGSTDDPTEQVPDWIWDKPQAHVHPHPHKPGDIADPSHLKQQQEEEPPTSNQEEPLDDARIPWTVKRAKQQAELTDATGI